MSRKYGTSFEASIGIQAPVTLAELIQALTEAETKFRAMDILDPIVKYAHASDGAISLTIEDGVE